MSIRRIISSKADLKVNLVPVLSEDFTLEVNYSEMVYSDYLHKHVDQLIDSTWVLIESPYTDKVYRDSYYTYFSSKLSAYAKDCLRLSFFDGEIKSDNFTTEDGYKNLQGRYLGFIILRPTDPNIVGRSAISPKAVKNNSFLCLTASIHATSNSLKFFVDAYPHSSQDIETITCAETTLWAIMEYFGNKYPEYKPVLPSQIINALKRVSAERQVPSKGLNIQQMAYALKEFGFGTKIYARQEFKGEFSKLFSTYIESGLPLIVAMENIKFGGTIAHALLCVGHEKITDADIDGLAATVETNATIQTQLQQGGISLYDNDDITKKFVFIDDNLPVYQLNRLSSPATHYPDAAWHNCEISYFIVPLYPKIYLEAFEAKSFFKKLLLESFTINNGEEIFIRFFLTSSRSYKNSLALNSSFDTTMREMILEIPMSKFLWIGEISTKTLIKQRKANGLVIIDATEANPLSLKALVIAAYKGDYIAYSATDKCLSKNSLPLGDFNIFTNNLKGF